ncbi:decaprenyl-phosphate phosphoribosyltransferase [Halospina sp. K52047b]|uniref:decaprenyl-phosphate phosphoribosyltransferase n=1 Tax=Halospina sp. K52047b TaxID=2614160 RepID=UPI001249F2BB|nr:decaprenyl-phosphate phosphoribosyltransferase [Halospina sp. K52047b]KAA8981273.1 decaprenyl-phosphate phosphoribosyltransferase [Halospina sp. K52047b]
MNAVIKLLRPHQYLKNGFVLIGPLFAHQWDAVTLTQAGLAFLAFCAMASAVYVLNDLLDVEADRAHPTKCKRPLPSGDMTTGSARGLLGVLVAISMVLSWLVSGWVLGFTMAYLLLNVVYSWRLKHVVILDVFLISAGFMLRIFAGTIGLGIAPSAWLLLCGLMVTLFLGFSKRRAELLVLENSEADYDSAVTRRVLDDYSPVMLEQFIAVTAACTVLSYGLYTVSPQTIELHGTPNLIYTVPFVVYGIFRYLFLLHQHSKGNDTARDLLTDWHMILAAFTWFGATLWVLA